MKSSSAQVSDRLGGRLKATADLSLRHEDHRAWIVRDLCVQEDTVPAEGW
jgi:hypothetical protein